MSKLKTEMVFINVPGELGSLWHNLCVLENLLGELLVGKPLGTQAIDGNDVWYLDEVDGELILMHATLHEGRLIEPSSRFDIDLEWVDIGPEELQFYNESLQTIINSLDTANGTCH